jgi:hypothetical protein
MRNGTRACWSRKIAVGKIPKRKRTKVLFLLLLSERGRKDIIRIRIFP